MKEQFDLDKLIVQFEHMAENADRLHLSVATSIDKQVVDALRTFKHVRSEFEVVQALFGKGDKWREITAEQIHNRMSEIMLELTKLQVKVKNYEPVSKYNGLGIEQWKARADHYWKYSEQMRVALVRLLEWAAAGSTPEKIVKEALLPPACDTFVLEVPIPEPRAALQSTAGTTGADS